MFDNTILTKLKLGTFGDIECSMSITLLKYIEIPTVNHRSAITSLV